MFNSFDIFNGLKFNICNDPKLANPVDVLDIKKYYGPKNYIHVCRDVTEKGVIAAVG